MVLMLHSNILHHAKEGIPQIGSALFFYEYQATQLILLHAHIFYYQMYQVVHLQRKHL